MGEKPKYTPEDQKNTGLVTEQVIPAGISVEAGENALATNDPGQAAELGYLERIAKGQEAAVELLERAAGTQEIVARTQEAIAMADLIKSREKSEETDLNTLRESIENDEYLGGEVA